MMIYGYGLALMETWVLFLCPKIKEGGGAYGVQWILT